MDDDCDVLVLVRSTGVDVSGPLKKNREFVGILLAPKHEQNRFSWNGVGKDEYEEYPK